MQSATLINVISAHMAEFGIVAPTGVPRIKELLTVIADKEDLRSPSLARTVLEGLVQQYLSLNDCPRIREQNLPKTGSIVSEKNIYLNNPH